MVKTELDDWRLFLFFRYPMPLFFEREEQTYLGGAYGK